MNGAVIVKVGGEGGGMTLLGRRASDNEPWSFALNVQSADCLLEEERDGAPAAPPRPEPEPVWVSTWPEAVGLLDRFQWAKLIPIEVHAEFREDLLVEATRRLISDPSDHARRSMNRWSMTCTDG